MTQGIYAFPLNQEIDFRNDEEVIPPHNIEAEEAILGGIILDPLAIHRVRHILKPEHFYIPAHKDIYAACFRLAKKGKNTDLIQLTSFLSDMGLLSIIGGRNKLASLVDRTVSALNIDAMASLVIEKATRRQLIKLGREIKKIAGSQEFELDEVMAILADKSSQMIQTPHYQTKEESQKCKHKRLLEELREIYTTIPDPSFRFFKLKELAQHYGYGTNFLEQLYLKSLTGECSKLLTYEELKELGGSEIREWLLNGLVPKASTILLAADGGLGKTKLVYRIAKQLIEGKDFGDFTATGKRKILYYQGDESPGDMVQALEMMGYSNPEINQNVKIRFGWSAENMPTLIQDIQQFQPDFVMIDSLSTANKFSIYKESDMEYARPLLEMAGLAAESGCTFLIVHHTNKEGGVRGTTAIRNAVSEVWHLYSDSSKGALPNDRILEINKSRSRSSGKKYKLFFNDEHLEFLYLGEDGEDKSTSTIRGQIKEFLKRHSNTRFTSEEISHRLNCSPATARKLLGQMGADGIISKIIRPGKANLYYLGNDCINISDNMVDHPEETPSNPDGARDTGNVVFITGSPGGSPLEIDSNPEGCVASGDVALITGSPGGSPLEAPQNDVIIGVTEKADPVIPQNNPEQTFFDETVSNCEKGGSADHLWLNPLPVENAGGDPLADPQGDPQGDPPGDTPIIENQTLQNETIEPEPEHRPIRSKYGSPLGAVRVIIQFQGDERWDMELIPPVGKTETKSFKAASPEEVKKKVKSRILGWYKNAPKPLKVGDKVKYIGFDRPWIQRREFTIFKIDFKGVWVRDKQSNNPDGPFKFNELIANP